MGDPQPKARPRIVRDRQGRSRAYTPESTKIWEDSIALQARNQIQRLGTMTGPIVRLPFDGRVMVEAQFWLRRPKSLPKRVVYPVTKPDADNLYKSLLDGLEKAGIVGNDARVTDLSVSKRYADDDHEPGVDVRITAWLPS